MVTLNDLVGKKIIYVEKVHDYIQIKFEGNDILSIYNKYEYNGIALDNIKTCKVLSVEETASKIVLYLDDGKNIIVGMDNADYFGPEAMVLLCADGATMVWN